MIKKFLLLSVVLTVGCQNNTLPVKDTVVKQETKTEKTSSVVTTNKEIEKLEFDSYPQEKNDNISKDLENKLATYVKDKEVFSFASTTSELYKIHFSGDGAPAYFSGDGAPAFGKGFSGDGAPAFITKAVSTDDYNWSRKPDKVLLDYFQLTNTVERSWGYTSYAKYSKIIEHTINITGAINSTKKVKLVQEVGFGMTQDGENYKLKSIAPISLRPVVAKDVPYEIRSATFSSDKNKIIIYGQIRLFPLPGISITKNIGNHKFKLFIEIAHKQGDKTEDIAVMVSIKNKQFQLQKTLGNIYGGEVEFPVLSSSDNMVVEVMDKKSLLPDTEYNGFTWIVPLTE